jgi:cell pole-organizing protein PopZ
MRSGTMNDMGQPNPTNDQPSMDDILSSIRRIIERSDTQDAAQRPAPDPAASTAAVPDAAAEVPDEETGAGRPPMSRSDLDDFAEALDARAPGTFDGRESVVDTAAGDVNVTPARANGKYEARFSEDDSRAFAEVASVLSATAGELRSAGQPGPAAAPVMVEVQPDEPPAAGVVDARTESVADARALEPLISSEVSRSVETSFSALSETLKAQAGRDLEAMTEQMLRPMLAEWLDDNLPSMVERLVRAEIERIARGDPRQG